LIRISITPAAFEAIAATLPLGSVGYESKVDTMGERLVWLEAAVVDRLTALRGPGESYSDVILRLVDMEAQSRSEAVARILSSVRPPGSPAI